MAGRDAKILIIVLFALGVAATAWYWREKLEPSSEPPAAATAESVAVEPDIDDEPRYPITSPRAAQRAEGELVLLPPLDDSDAYFTLALVEVLGSDIEALLARDALIDRFVTTIDNLPRDHVAEKIRPVGRLSEPFRVDATGSDGPIYLSPDNFRRYDALVAQLAAADLDAVVDTYRRFYPLFQESYERLGYPDRYFNDRLIDVIDHLLETPELDDPIRLVRPHLLYEFADPELEPLSSGQKLMLRMGKDHAAIVKRTMRELRTELARP